jgi:hypothetical protein
VMESLDNQFEYLTECTIRHGKCTSTRWYQSLRVQKSIRQKHPWSTINRRPHKKCRAYEQLDASWHHAKHQRVATILPETLLRRIEPR